MDPDQELGQDFMSFLLSMLLSPAASVQNPQIVCRQAIASKAGCQAHSCGVLLDAPTSF